MVAQSLGSQRLFDSDMVLHWALRTVNYLAVLHYLTHLPDILLNSMKSLDDSSTSDYRLGNKDHSFVAGKEHLTVVHGCSSLDLKSMSNLL